MIAQRAKTSKAGQSEETRIHSPKICILGATFNTENMGVSMLAAGAIRCVLHRFPNAQIIMLDYAYEPYNFNFAFEGRSVPVRFVNLRFSKKFYLANNIALLLALVLFSKAIPSEALRRRFLSANPWLKELLDSRLVFAVSGGDSFSDIYGVARFLYVALPQLLALFAQKRLVLLPQTIGPFRNPVVHAIARNILANAEVVYSRDRIGLEATKRTLGSDRGLKFCYDMAFEVDPRKPASLDIVGLQDSELPLVGFNISGLLLVGGYTQKNMFGLRVDYRDLVSEVIGFLIMQKSARVLLVPHVFGSAEHLESDTGACESIYQDQSTKYPGRIGLVRGKYAYDEIKYVIGRCDFFVGARMHACIGAISQHIPTALIAYSDKFRGVVESVGAEDLVVDPRKLGLDEIVSKVDDIYERRLKIRSNLAAKIPSVKRVIRECLRDLAVEGERGA